MRAFGCFALIFLLIFTVLACSESQPQLAKDAKKSPRKNTRRAMNKKKMQEWVLAALNKDTPAEERRVALRIVELNSLREEMQKVIKSLPEEQSTAQNLQSRMLRMQEKYGENIVKNALGKAAIILQNSQSSGAPASDVVELKVREVLRAAGSIDAQLDKAMKSELVLSSDTPRLRRLKAELKEQQKATMRLATATRAAFRGLSVLQQMKKAISLLEARKE